MLSHMTLQSLHPNSDIDTCVVQTNAYLVCLRANLLLHYSNDVPGHYS